MLDHVGAEKVLVPQHVERRDQSQEHHQRAQMETGLLPGRGSPIPSQPLPQGTDGKKLPQGEEDHPGDGRGFGLPAERPEGR